MIIATHLPFFINPERLEQVRLIARSSAAGSVLESDWGKAPEGLLPVLGSLGPNIAGRIPLLVEGQDDREYLTALSEACRRAGKVALSTTLHPLPSGGS